MEIQNLWSFMASQKMTNPIVPGSSKWITQELENSVRTMFTETQRFAESVNYELDWLDEQMGEILEGSPNLVMLALRSPKKLQESPSRKADGEPLTNNVFQEPVVNNIPELQTTESYKKEKFDEYRKLREQVNISQSAIGGKRESTPDNSFEEIKESVRKSMLTRTSVRASNSSDSPPTILGEEVLSPIRSAPILAPTQGENFTIVEHATEEKVPLKDDQDEKHDDNRRSTATTATTPFASLPSRRELSIKRSAGKNASDSEFQNLKDNIAPPKDNVSTSLTVTNNLKMSPEVLDSGFASVGGTPSTRVQSHVEIETGSMWFNPELSERTILKFDASDEKTVCESQFSPTRKKNVRKEQKIINHSVHLSPLHSNPRFNNVSPRKEPVSPKKISLSPIVKILPPSRRVSSAKTTAIAKKLGKPALTSVSLEVQPKTSNKKANKKSINRVILQEQIQHRRLQLENEIRNRKKIDVQQIQIPVERNLPDIKRRRTERLLEPKVLAEVSTDRLNKTASLGNGAKSPFAKSVQPQSKRSIFNVFQRVTPSTNEKPSELPEIFSESEDDAEGSVLQPWAEFGQLKIALIKQQSLNPVSVFGSVLPLDMDAIFRSYNRFNR
ncbi:Hypothetical protein PP7435_CHR3-0124 [Komagataella phaffii CBS 7435]|uniref:Inner centromere protein ARK-binding domain-containing protein n=2 Tax=Komagataella phaffii TaxID=460519 RepID=C4R6C0_KOMPG|nr:Hypothetical protein PAS_chr3_1043 [Komagataella phaffii GS115]AOA64074.1 GQ67_04174T0 [Komagataella phaffii]CAH2449054.1 Hypothetical protein BQ9382_C3-0730 [Komagataella phaffii CBS 7435]AOA68753.1 GQ68_04147T0 [Komagataella phaffii GS115]CAY71106.1 Hypothetical protein PAS_chr3_1043 [Komagataella phaffii GS115]SCV12159.1 Hypothetical protein PP7435_CHR3-0124 [Komagataella phaffii CBS 7435]